MDVIDMKVVEEFFSLTLPANSTSTEGLVPVSLRVSLEKAEAVDITFHFCVYQGEKQQ